MSLKFLPLPIYIAVCLLISISLVLVAKKRSRTDGKNLIVIYLTVALMPLLAATGKLFKPFSDITAIVILVLLGVLFIELIVALFKQKNIAHAKRTLLLSLGILIISFLPLLIILIFFNK